MLFQDKYKPPMIEQMLLPKSVKALLMSITPETMTSMIFHGSSGLGKTLATDLIIKMLDAAVFDIDVANKEERSINGIEAVEEFLSRRTKKMRIIRVQEADKLNSGFLDVLKYFFEQNMDNVYWLFTTNHIEKFESPILSRITPIDFNPTPADKKELLIEICEHLCHIWKEETGIDLFRANLNRDKEHALLLWDYADSLYPDIRRSVNTLQRIIAAYVESNELTYSRIVKASANKTADNLFKWIFTEGKNMIEVRDLYTETPTQEVIKAAETLLDRIKAQDNLHSIYPNCYIHLVTLLGNISRAPQYSTPFFIEFIFQIINEKINGKK